ncbi:olfactory receptor 52P1-like [Chelonoidis abingdonii]|uniref:olfactory receptor 52P1-like n=1 Tax=Chelonoidis abingdonii TaxID=106734 RepID=UPI0013F18705|nr:putative olfactory receptor 52P1 [Chelonoidis abingdonii]
MSYSRDLLARAKIVDAGYATSNTAAECDEQLGTARWGHGKKAQWKKTSPDRRTVKETVQEEAQLQSRGYPVYCYECSMYDYLPCTLSIPEPDRRIDHLIAAFNLTPSDPSTFILMGIPGLEAAHIWISILFSTSYIISLLGNFIVLFVVGKEQTLHKPMYLLLCILAVTDISTSTSIVLKALCIFWFKLEIISVSGCLTQMFFFHTGTVMHSAILATMAFDSYVAIHNPLRYATILTNARIAKLGLVGLIRAIFFVLPLPLLLIRQPFCANRIIPHTYCDHMAVAKMSCGDITFNRMYGLVIPFVVNGSDLTLIALFYGLIIRAVLRISSKKVHQKTLNTCTAHICVMLMSYPPFFFSTMTHRFGQGITPHIHIILANLYFLLPTMLNAIIYGAKTKELWEKVGKYTCRMWSLGGH